MPLINTFLHTAVVTRPTDSTLDALNQPTAGAATTVYTALAGRLVERQERLYENSWAVGTLKTVYMYITGGSADIQPGDIIISVTLEDDTTATHQYRVTDVVRRVARYAAHHKTAMLEVIE